MSLKKLSQFNVFDWNKFSAGKRYMCLGVSELTDYNTKKHMGTKVEAVITDDRTPYQTKDGEQVTNAYEKLTFKVRKDVKIPINAFINPVNVDAKVYGDFRNQLSITCDDIQVIGQAKG
ncbi:MAG: hypothetical protein K2N34_15340 [Lachnospiraceae bacterium]|nr:hypothetical protein [Lachnospiraceae bacterium]